MSIESMIGNLGTYMDMQTLGLYNNMMTMGYPYYLGMGGLTGFPSYNLPFSSVLTNVLGSLSANGLNAQNIAGFRTISADSELQKELNKLGYGNMMILVPEEYQKQVEENTDNSQKVSETFKKWKTNYDAVNGKQGQTRVSTGNQSKVSTGSQARIQTGSSAGYHGRTQMYQAGVSHNHVLGNCTFGKRV